MRRVFFTALALLLGCAPHVARVRADAPLDFHARDVGGGSYELSQDRGAVVLVDVWATWCNACQHSLPVIAALGEKYRSAGLRVYALSLDTEPHAIAPFLSSRGLRLSVLLDPEAEIADQVFQVKQMPTTFLIDRRGVLRRRLEGTPADLDQRLEADLQKLLAERGAP